MSTVVWHDLECGAYTADLPTWLSLAEQFGGPILDIGAGSGRVTIELARSGHQVVALDCDSELLAALRLRAAGLPVEIVQADARQFDLHRRFPLAIVPMQTIQLLSGGPGRARFFAAVARHLEPHGLLALAISPDVDEFTWEPGFPLPLPDIVELHGTVFSSQPTAVRTHGDTVVLERLRETIGPEGQRLVEHDQIVLDVVDAEMVIAEATSAGLREVGRRSIAPTAEHVGGEILLLMRATQSAGSGPVQP
jgi:SAM-dependent methyltransferase